MPKKTKADEAIGNVKLLVEELNGALEEAAERNVNVTITNTVVRGVATPAPLTRLGVAQAHKQPKPKKVAT